MSSQVGAWDDHLFKETAEFYKRGRIPYADDLPAVLSKQLGLDGTGALVDLGSGPGSLALILAPLFATVLAVDPDPGMIEFGQRDVERQNVGNVDWRIATAEEIDLSPAGYDVATFGQSFHWMDRPLVAARLRAALRPGGHLVLITDVKTGATTSGGPPKADIERLITEYLGPVRRAGRKLLPNGTPSDEEKVLADSGYQGPEHIIVGAPGRLRRSIDEVIAEVYSRSSSAPHQFGAQLSVFEARLRTLLERHAIDGGFVIDRPATDVRIWTNPPGHWIGRQ